MAPKSAPGAPRGAKNDQKRPQTGPESGPRRPPTTPGGPDADGLEPRTPTRDDPRRTPEDPDPDDARRPPTTPTPTTSTPTGPSRSLVAAWGPFRISQAQAARPLASAAEDVCSPAVRGGLPAASAACQRAAAVALVGRPPAVPFGRFGRGSIPVPVRTPSGWCQVTVTGRRKGRKKTGTAGDYAGGVINERDRERNEVAVVIA